MKSKIVITAAIALSVVACGKHEYPAAVVTNFVNSCLQSGGSAQSCTCSIDKIQKKLSFEEFNKLEARYALGDKDAISKIADLVAECR